MLSLTSNEFVFTQGFIIVTLSTAILLFKMYFEITGVYTSNIG